jgi:hypothetical protein
MIKEEERRNKEIKLQNNNDNTIYVTNKKEFLNNISIKEKRKKIRVNNSDKIIKSNENLKKLKPKFSKSKSFISLNKYECHNIEKLKYDLTKDYNLLHIDKDENFMERMKFDIYKRQIREDRINKLIEEYKIKIDENDRIKAFNRLIEDANRRIEAQVNLEIMKNKLDKDDKNNKKYNEKEWGEIYKNRFKNYEIKVNNKIEKLIDEKKKLNKKIEDEEINMCKIKKGTKKQIQEFIKRLYEDSIKRRLKMENKKNNYILYDNDVSKYKTKDKTLNYNFIDDDDDLNNFKNNINNSQKKTKTKKQFVSEFNNLRFDKNNEKEIKNENIQLNKNNSTNNKLNNNNINEIILNNNNNLEEIENKQSNNNNTNEEQINNIIYQNPNILKEISNIRYEK